MRLIIKVGLILSGVFILYGFVAFGIQRFIIFPSFISLERDEAIEDSNRILEGIKREIHHLNLLCWDWASWDETYEFIESSSKDYIKANLVFTSFTDNNLNLIYICDAQGKVIWGEIHDLETEKMIHLPRFPKDHFSQTHPLLMPKTGKSPLSNVIAGIFMTSKGPMLISARPILDSQNQGPVRGTFVMGRFLNAPMIETLVDQTRVDFQIFPIQADLLPEPISGIPNRLSDESPNLIRTRDDDHLEVYTTFPDIEGDAALLISAGIPRKIAAKGIATLHNAIYSVLATGVVVMVVVLLLLQKTILTPITNLINHVLSIGKTGDLSTHLAFQRRDEIGSLAHEFDKMMMQLSEVRGKLMEQSYYFGMAEMASGVLHSIRNSLNPIKGNIELLRANFQKIPVNEIEKAQKELDRGGATDEREEDLIKFLVVANKRLTNLTNDAFGKLDDATEQIKFIESILDDHQKWAYSDRPVEEIDSGELIQNAVDFIKGNFDSRVLFNIDPGVSKIGVLRGNKIALFQILVNVLTNAAESVQRKGPAQGEIQIQASIDKEDDREMVHFKIRDTGAGIDSEIIEHMFEYGFSTKREEASGFGLHWCANTVTAMNGHMNAESAGAGKGACVHVILPREFNLNPKEREKSDDRS